MPKIPGTFKTGIPPNIEYDALTPPVKNMCSNMLEVHAPDCDGDCVKVPLTELEVNIINENREWARAGMDTQHVIRDVFRMSIQIKALVRIVEELAPGKLDEVYQRALVAEMRGIREANQDEIRAQRLGVGPKLVGPNGKPLMQ